MTKIEKRKIVPIAAKISAGKSFLLNVIYNIDFLECKAGIGTKFVNILRYNPNLDQPCFYHLKVEKEKNGEYIFKKDPEYETKFGKKDIIEDNKNINQILAATPKEAEINYEDIFYMTELNEVEFIKDKEYLLTHDLCDIPGLSEYQAVKTNENKKLVDDNDFESKVLKGVEEFGIVYKPKILKEKKEKVKEKDQDDIYYEIDIENEKTYLTEIFKIIKNYIEGIIIVLSIENFYHEENFEIITKLAKVIKKDISNSLIILNKIDLSQDPDNDIEKCKGLFIQKFPKCKTFNLNLNTFIPLSAIQLQNELLMKNSFIHLIKYHFYNYYSNIMKEKTTIGKSFIEHLTSIIFLEENGISNETIKHEVDQLKKSENIEIINDQIKNVLKELKNRFKADNIIFGISENDFINNEKDDEDDEDDDDEDKNTLDPTYIIKMIYILYKKKKLPPISNEANELLNYFNLKNINKTNYKIIEDKQSNLNKLNKELINEFELFGEKIKNNKTGNDKFKNLTDEIARFIHFLKIYNVIFIPFLGPSNAGKSTIINGIIGREILPTSLNECTKRGILIKYTDSEETNLYKAYFREENDFLGKINYYFKAITDKSYLIAQGEKEVKETLTSLNYGFNDKEEDSFFYIKTRIKLFDDIKLNDSLKQMIYLIDFPGFGTGNIFEKQNIYDKVMSICNSFIFVVRNSVIKENTCQNRLKQIFDQVQIQKKKFASEFIKSCLFILNNDIDQSTTEDDLNKVKGDIQSILNIKVNDMNDLKLCFFNSKYYDNYCRNYNYFHNLENLFKEELDKYKNRKNSFYKNPFSITKVKEDNGFLNLFYNNLKEKIKNLFEIKNLNKLLKNQVVNNEFQKNFSDKLNVLITKNDIYDSNFNENKEKLLKIISLGQNKLPELKILKESNIDKFKDILYLQINYINDIKQKDLIEETENVINLLDMFFKRDFSERKKDLNEIKNLYNWVDTMKIEIKKTITINENKIEEVKNDYKRKIKNSLLSNKEQLKSQLESKDYTNILEEINKQISAKLIGLNKEIIEYLKFNEKQNYKLSEMGKRIIINFSLKKYSKLENNFMSYMSKKLGNGENDFENQILVELKNSCENTTNILFKKGIKEWFNSLFSDLSYLENIIDILIDTSLKKINFIFDLIKDQSIYCLKRSVKKIVFLAKAATLEFNDEQKNKWKELCISYEKTREKLIFTKNFICYMESDKKSEDSKCISLDNNKVK